MEEILLIQLVVVNLLHIVLSIGVTIHVLLNKTEEKTAIAWIALVVFSPFVGATIYLLFGINRIRRKSTQMRRKPVPSTDHPVKTGLGKSPGRSVLDQIEELGSQVTDRSLYDNNTICCLMNGDQTYPAMLEAIEQASRSVYLSSYIFNCDAAGKQFLNALRDAVQKGVRVRVLIDDFGMRYSLPTIESSLRKAGVTAARFLPTRKAKYIPFLNLRNHRKILICDERQAYVGGINIAKGNVLADKPARPIQDIHFAVSGPVVSQITEIFLEDWSFATGERIEAAEEDFSEDSLPVPGALCATSVRSRIISDGPDEDYGKLRWVLLGVISSARKSIRIVTPYFLPDSTLLNALQVASLRGVAIEIILPQKSNLFWMDWAMNATISHLLEYGIHIYQARPPFDHSKLLIIDGAWSLVGSSNWDERSLKLNFEINLECQDAEFARILTQIFADKKKHAALIVREHWNPSFLQTLRNNSMRLFNPYL